MKINIGDLFVRKKTRTQISVVFYISGIHKTGQYELCYIDSNPNHAFRHKYYEEETLKDWVKNGIYEHFPVKQ